MKRSEVNAALAWAEDLLSKNNIRLPDMAYLTAEELKSRAGLETVKEVMLGWDITDFGSGDFSSTGAVLYTVRNGCVHQPEIGVPYCEKYILMREGQHLPKHYHVYKTEDIINRAGGVLEVFLWNTDENGNEIDTPVTVYMDGIPRTFKAGEPICVTKGNSISLTPHMAHVFSPKNGTGDLVAGEVSRINDDNTDNYFLEPVARFAAIEEDEPARRCLCNEM